MIANVGKRRNENWFVRWLMDWADWFGILMSIVFVAVVAMFVVIPGCSVSETKLKNGAELMSYDELDRGVNDFSALLEKAKKDPYNGMLYWDVLIEYSKLEAQCAAFHLHTDPHGEMAMSNSRSPCYRIQGGEEKFHFSDYTMEHQSNVSREAFEAASASYRGMHPIEMDTLFDHHADSYGGLTETVWHTEKLWEAYRNGVPIMFIFFAFRICSKRLRLDWEVKSLRLFVVSIAWPATFWYYPGNAYQQAKEIKRFVGYILSFVVSFLSLGVLKIAEARDESLSFGGSAQSSYILDNGRVANDGWVIQPWAEADTAMDVGKQTLNAYVGLWGSSGLESDDGNEIDFTGGVRTVVAGLKLDVSYNYYDFLKPGNGMHVPKLVACYTDLGLCGKFQYMIPDIVADPGMQIGVWWSRLFRPWEYLSVKPLLGLIHTRDVYGSIPVNTLKLELAMPLTKKGPEVFFRGYIPWGMTNPDAVGLVGIRFAF